MGSNGHAHDHFNVDNISVCSMSTMTFVEAWWDLDFQLNRRGYNTKWAWPSKLSLITCAQPHHKKIPRSAPVFLFVHDVCVVHFRSCLA